MTPGPWKVLSGTYSYGQRRKVIAGENGYILIGGDNQKANAQLIAAAPRMYSWMKRMAPSWDAEAHSIMNDLESTDLESDRKEE